MEQVRAASDVDYESTYLNYYGHNSDASSFHTSLASLVKSKSIDCEKTHLPILDIGGGSGLLSATFAGLGITSTFIDVNPGVDGIKLNLAVYNENKLSLTKKIIANKLGYENWFSTCLDVIEHISLRDMASFLININALVTGNLLISISTRPSADGNRYHPTVLPIETWTKLLDASGLSCVDNDYVDWKGVTAFTGIDDKISTVAYWCRRNIFHDNNGHQHYLLLEKNRLPDKEKLEALIDSLVTPRTLDEKRLPLNVLYTVNFIQDWHFLRELMDFLKKDELIVVFNKDNISQINLNVIRNFVVRCGIQCFYLDDVLFDVESFLSSLNPKVLFISATEGPVSKRHLATIPFVEAANRAGHNTVCLQHGMILPDRMAFPSTHFLAWSDMYKAEAITRCSDGVTHYFYNAGVIKNSSFYVVSKYDFISLRFGEHYLQYEKKVLVASNLHWRAAHLFTPIDFISWLKKEAVLNKNVLFIWRPHPEEYSIYLVNELPENVLVIEQMITDIIDVSICQILKNVDACITTLSTIAFDAVRLGTPVAIFPFDCNVGRDISLSAEVIEKSYFISDISSFNVHDFVYFSSASVFHVENKDTESGVNDFMSLLESLYYSAIAEYNPDKFGTLTKYYDSAPPMGSIAVAEWQEKYCCGKL